MERNRYLEAEYYDSEYYFQDDVNLFLRMAGEIPGEVLELACGTGRIVIPFAQAGYKITGIDISQEMLAKAQEKINNLPREVKKRITLLQKDMRSFRLPKRFQLIILAFNSLLLATTPEEQKIVISHAYRHLAPGGRLFVCAINPNREWFREHVSTVKYYGTWIYQTTGKLFDRFYSNSNDSLHKLMTFSLFYDHINEDKSVKREKNPITLRYLFSFELQYLLEQAGFVITRLYGNYDEGFFSPQSPLMIFEALKKIPPTRIKSKK